MGRHTPALLGGVAIGVLSGLPVVGAVNMCCCLWVVLGGGLVAYLQQQRTPEPLETGEAVLGGLIAGALGAVISVALTTAFGLMMGPMAQQQMQMVLEQNPDIPPEFRDFVLRMASGEGMFIMQLLISLPIFSVMSMLGALIGVAIFRKKPPVVNA